MISSNGGSSLRRRRGTKTRRRNPATALWAMVCVLGLALVGAVTLLVGLYTSLTAEEKQVTVDRMRHKVQAVPNLLRGKQQQLQVPVQPHDNSNASNKKPVARPGSPVVSADSGGGSGSFFTSSSSKTYPYSLDKLATESEVSSYSPRGGFRFEEYKDGDSPYKITDELRQKSDALARSRRNFVKGAMQFAWGGYTKYAFGYDEIKPQSAVGDNGWGGQGITLVDALDTLWLMGMKDEFWEARNWVRDNLNHGTTGFTSVFETTIRDLGGLLSAYDLSGDESFLTKAVDLGTRLLHAFDDAPSGIPFGQVNLRDGNRRNIGKSGMQNIHSIDDRWVIRPMGSPPVLHYI